MSKDIIYREDAIKAINLRARIPHDIASAHYASMAINAIRSVPSADRPQEWIPCSERLPSNFGEDETVLATTDVDGDKVIAMFALDVKSFYLKGYVSAWMPLPAPWKGADDE